MNLKNSKIFIYLLIEIPIVILLGKAYLINTHHVDTDNTLIYRIFQSVAHDSIIYFGILLIAYFSYQKFMPYFLSIAVRTIALLFFAIYVVDIYILNHFANHLVLNDVFKYISYAPTYIQQFYQINIFIIILSLVIFTFAICFVLTNFKIEDKKSNYSFIISLLVLLGLNQFSQEGRFIHSWLYKNLIEYNIEIYEQSTEYSQEFISTLKTEDNKLCIESKEENPNIVILMVESLASYQSDYFSKLRDWTPNLDKIAQDNISFSNFYANGFVTEDAEIALITGEIPIYSPKAFHKTGGVAFNGFYNLENSLPNLLKKKDYNNEFITSSDLIFSNTGNWALSTGFDYIEGSEHKYYDNRHRIHFEAAADEYLYDRVLDRIKKQDSKYFIFVKTVSSHAPFTNPEDLSNSEEGTIKYIDKQIGNFYNELEKMDFFKDGLLVIVGDHHPVIPVKSDALDKFGEIRAPSVLPLIIAYKNKKLNIKDSFQQIDVYNSLKNLTSDTQCTSRWIGDFLSEKRVTPEYIFHRRGEHRGIISVFSEEKDFNVKLLGDNTKVINNTENKEVINKINLSRIKRLEDKYKFKYKF